MSAAAFQMPQAVWMNDRLVAERGIHAGFQMYSREGNDAVGAMVQGVIAQAEADELRPVHIRILLIEGVAQVAEKFPEIRDTEPEVAIVDTINAYFATVGFAPIGREVLS